MEVDVEIDVEQGKDIVVEMAFGVGFALVFGFVEKTKYQKIIRKLSDASFILSISNRKE